MSLHWKPALRMADAINEMALSGFCLVVRRSAIALADWRLLPTLARRVHHYETGGRPLLGNGGTTMRLQKPPAERRQQPRGLETAAPPRAQLVSMIVGTFREMPGLCLHANQAARLFDLPPSTCQIVLDDLVTQGKLRRASDGQYLRAELDSPSLRDQRSGYGHVAGSQRGQ
jgi:hypothetical protein